MFTCITWQTSIAPAVPFKRRRRGNERRSGASPRFHTRRGRAHALPSRASGRFASPLRLCAAQRLVHRRRASPFRLPCVCFAADTPCPHCCGPCRPRCSRRRQRHRARPSPSSRRSPWTSRRTPCQGPRKTHRRGRCSPRAASGSRPPVFRGSPQVRVAVICRGTRASSYAYAKADVSAKKGGHSFGPCTKKQLKNNCVVCQGKVAEDGFFFGLACRYVQQQRQPSELVMALTPPRTRARAQHVRPHAARSVPRPRARPHLPQPARLQCPRRRRIVGARRR